MVPIKHSSIFKSRWMALLWAAGIIWMAIDFAAPSQPSSAPQVAASDTPPTDSTGASINPEQERQLAQIISGM